MRGRVTACVAIGVRDFHRCCRSRSRRTSSKRKRSSLCRRSPTPAPSAVKPQPEDVTPIVSLRDGRGSET
nr:hypothetical protein Itr_chr14CG10180 [Ipomoea trifida]